MTIKLKPVCAGEDMVLTVTGGYARRPVPSDGVVVETGENEIFLPETQLAEALRQLALMRQAASGRAAPRRAPAQHTLPIKKASG